MFARGNLWILPILAALVPLSPARAVDHDDQHWANYVGVQWHTEITSEMAVGGLNGGVGATTNLSGKTWVEVTKRIHGQVVCQEHKDLGVSYMGVDGTFIGICGGTAIHQDQSSYYDGPESNIAKGDGNWYPAPHHDFTRGLFIGLTTGYDQFWTNQWTDPPAPTPAPPPPPQSNNTGPEVVFLSNCQDRRGWSSEMNWYPHEQATKNGEYPQATAIITPAQTVNWEGQSIVGKFPDGNEFTSNITDHNGPLFAVKGSGFNHFHGFTCHQDNFRVLYHVGDNTCHAVYYCEG